MFQTKHNLITKMFNIKNFFVDLHYATLFHDTCSYNPKNLPRISTSIILKAFL